MSSSFVEAMVVDLIPVSSSSSSSTSLSTTPLPMHPIVTSCDFILDNKNYIPAGCLRIERYKCRVSKEQWEYCDEWKALVHPRELAADPNGAFLHPTVQDALLRSDSLSPFQTLYQAGWIQLRFKTRDDEWGQVRVFILPDDVGNSRIDRNEKVLRRSLQNLLSQLDIAGHTWEARWSLSTPIKNINTSLKSEEGSEISLFDLFNTLPSPTPEPEVVEDLGIRAAMESILSGEVEGVNTTMMAYQRRSAAMMLQRESQPAEILDPRLRTLSDRDGKVWYCDPVTGHCLRNPRMYETARGGICAETMGYGKTLICLALIMATRDFSSQIPVEHSIGTIPVRPKVGSLVDMAAATIGRTGTPWKSYFSEIFKTEGMVYDKCIEAIRKGIGYYLIPAPVPRRTTRNPICAPPRKIYLTTATLVVVPPNLVRQWQREIEKHTTGLKVLVMSQNKDELPPALELREYDIVLFSRLRFEQEARDGSDDQGRRASSRTKCTGSCPVNPATQKVDCNCYQVDQVYHSPLRELHFKRLITDEGHNMGNSSKTTKSNAVVVVDYLQVSSRWIVSGTPTQGLYGADKTPRLFVRETEEALKLDSLALGSGLLTADHRHTSDSSPEPNQNRRLQVERKNLERKDLEKLGNIATTYLKCKPWANSQDDSDYASWSQYVIPPKHGSKSPGHSSCLRDTLAGMIIRHRPEDIEKDVELPPLHQKIVYLDGSVQDKLSLNLFALMINSNAVTSERKDADYLFHQRQRKPLAQLVANLRQASFFWSGFTKQDVEFTRNLAQAFLAKDEVEVSGDDKDLLLQGINTASSALSSSIWISASEHHEMPFYIANDCSVPIREAWALDGIAKNPTLLGATQLRSLQKYVSTTNEITQLSTRGLEDAGRAALEASKAQPTPVAIKNAKVNKIQKRLDEALPKLAGGVKLGIDSSPRKKQRISAPENSQKTREISDTQGGDFNTHASIIDDSLASATIISTASAKLSYLVDQVIQHHKEEKIIIFYENDNVAFYIAQALETVNVEHLIYAKTLKSDRRSKYLVTFNNSSRFRCLLMDISQAAFGLDVSSASRVYFVNPVLSKQVEAQAVKRAHRIGQFKPVHVETLVLRSSIEEMIVERRQHMSNEEQKKCKSVLDDETMYDWIKNVRFVPLPLSDAPAPEQCAKLQFPHLIFGHDSTPHDPDSGLVDFDQERKTDISTNSIEEPPEHRWNLFYHRDDHNHALATNEGTLIFGQHSRTGKTYAISFIEALPEIRDPEDSGNVPRSQRVREQRSAAAAASREKTDRRGLQAWLTSRNSSERISRPLLPLGRPLQPEHFAQLSSGRASGTTPSSLNQTVEVSMILDDERSGISDSDPSNGDEDNGGPERRESPTNNARLR